MTHEEFIRKHGEDPDIMGHFFTDPTGGAKYHVLDPEKFTKADWELMWVLQAVGATEGEGLLAIAALVAEGRRVGKTTYS